jgi:methionyl-tRNA formyltransferase
LSNTWRKRSKDDGKINFKMTSKDIHNLVRALSKPYIGAHINYKNKDIIVWRTKIIKFQKQNIEPGKVLISNKNSITVKSADGAIEIIESEFVKFPKKGEYL